MTTRRSFLKGLVAAAAGVVARAYSTPELPAPVEVEPVVAERSIIDDMPAYRAHAPEAFFGPYLSMAGALGGRWWTSQGTRFGEYEAVAGTGQAHVWFDL